LVADDGVAQVDPRPMPTVRETLERFDDLDGEAAGDRRTGRPARSQHVTLCGRGRVKHRG